ncbi:MAG: V-type ATP synthase subunit I [Lachnospiraceae bacterium]|nr:V-type ATP synthase subunit I [Lachnospiraceae bacterium]
MSVVSMQKMLIAGMREEQDAVLKELQRRRLFHLSKMEEETLSAPEVKEKLTRAEKQAQLADNALKLLNEYAPADEGMFASLKGGRELSADAWQEKALSLPQAAALAESLLEKQKGIGEAAAKAARAQVLLEGLVPWEGLDMPLNTSETGRCRVLIGALPGAWTEESLKEALAAGLPGFDTYELELLKGDATQTPLVLLCLKEDAPAVEDLLRKKGFAKPILVSDKTPAEAKEDLQFEKAAAVTEGEELKAAIRAAAPGRDALQFLYDESQLEAGRLAALAKTGEGSRSFFLSGYVPANRAEALKKQLEDKYTVSVSLIDAAPEEAVPVALHNNRFAAPTESVVESYGLPGEGEVDPTGIMAIFYYFLFGLMLSDAGYGLLMIVGCGLVLKKFPKMSRSTKQMMTMFFWCGVSTFLWGILFGGFFGDAIDVIAHTFFGVPKDVQVFKPLWFAPLEKPMKLLVYSFLFGVLHLFVGLGLKGWQLLKQKRVMDFIGSVLSWFLLLIGLILMLLPSDLFASISGSPIPIPEPVQSAAKILALIGAVGLLLFAAWDRKNFGLRLALGAYELYGITGWLSDVLSYSRLLALGLATGVIASVINSMASMFGGGVKGAILFIIIFLVGHALNMAINLLGAYVHTNRLQYVEFFGKFYDGGGEAYEPLTTDNTKYYHMEET